MGKKSSNSFVGIAAMLVALIAISPVAFPSLCWHGLMIADAFYPFMYHNQYVDMYHKFLISRLEEREEEPLPELLLRDANKESLYKATNGYTTPLIIRGALANVTAMKLWSNRSWWMENYANESVMVIILVSICMLNH